MLDTQAAWLRALFGLVTVLASVSPTGPQDRDDTPAILTGRVVRVSDGKPLPGATVRCVQPAGRVMGCATGWMAELPLRTELVVTDADGRFAFEFPGGLGLNDIHVLPTPETGMSWVRWSTPSDQGRHWLLPGEAVDVEVLVPARHELQGVVVDSDGSTVGGAEVKVWHAGRVHGPDGRYLPPDLVIVAESDGSFDVSSTGPRAELEAVAAGCVADDRLLASTSPGDCLSGLRLTLSTATYFEGKVVNPSGSPVGDLPLYAIRGSLHEDWQPTAVDGVERRTHCWALARTDAAGRFQLGPLPHGAVTVSTQLRPFLPWTQTVEPDGRSVHIALEAGATLVGTVRGADGQPLPGARVETLAYAGSPQVTGHDGTFRFTGVPSSFAVNVTVHAEGHASQVLADMRVPADVLTRLDVQLERGYSIAGCVIDGEGQPYAGQMIYARGDRIVPGVDQRSAMWTRMGYESTSVDEMTGHGGVRTDQEGCFRIDGLYPGRFHLAVGFPPQSFFVLSGDESVVLALARPEDWRRRLLGNVVDSRSGESIEDFEVSAVYGSSSPRGPELLGREGHRFVLDLGSGHTRVTVAAPGHAYWFGEFVGDDGRDYQQDIPLVRGRRLALRVVDADGAPVPRCELSFWSRDEKVSFEKDGCHMRNSVRTNRHGNLVVDRLPPELLTVRCPRLPSADGHTRSLAWDIDLTQDNCPESVDLRVTDAR